MKSIMHVNPLYPLSKAMARTAIHKLQPVESAWGMFSEYLRFVLRGDKEHASEVLSKIESTVDKLLKRLKKPRCSDELIEAGALAYFVLAHSGAVERQKYLPFKEALRARTRECIDDLPVVGIERSPALSRCLGFSYIHLDVLGEDEKSYLKELFDKKCLSGNIPSAKLFCVVATFGIALHGLLTGSKDDASIAMKAIKRFTEVVRPNSEQIALVLIAHAIASRVVGRGLSQMMLYDLVESLMTDLSSRNLLETRKKLWIQVRLALRLNRLHVLSLLYGDRIALDRSRLYSIIRELEQRLHQLIDRYGLLAEILMLIHAVIVSALGVIMVETFVVSVLAVVAAVMAIFASILVHISRMKASDCLRDVKALKSEATRREKR